MNQFESFLCSIHTVTGVPVHYYKNDILYCKLPDIASACDPVPSYVPFLKAQKDKALYFSTNEHHYYGIVNSLDRSSCIIAGPVICTLARSQNLKQIMHDAHIPAEYEEEFRDFIKTIPRISHLKLKNLLVLFYRELNHEDIDPENINDTVYLAENINSELNDENIAEQENVDVTEYYKYERKIYGIIEAGDCAGMKNALNRITFPPVGRLANSEMRQAKNVFIIRATVCARAAIQGGLDVKSALELCNHYIHKMEECPGINSLEKLHAPMCLDFTQKAYEAKIPSNLSRDVYRSVQFIRENVNKPIAVDDVARCTAKSRSLISKKFKQEMGINLNSFIVSCKLETARGLLRFTEKPISDISAYLYFSSQSYFQNLFKKKYGLTPNKFRQTYKQSLVKKKTSRHTDKGNGN
jgi:AraC-like DNA-binding protein